MNNYSEAILYAVLRLILGVLFFFQGYDKIFKLRIKTVIESYRNELESTRVSYWILAVFVSFTSYIELIAGSLLILGLFKTVALYLLGLNLIIVACAQSIITPMWNMQLFFPRAIIWAILMYLCGHCDLFSMDYLMQKNQIIGGS